MAVALPGIKYAFVDAGASGLTSIVPAPGAGLRLVVIALFAVASAPVSINFAGSVSGQLTATMSLAANGGMVLNENDSGWFQTGDNEALEINLSAAAAVGVTLSYLTQVVP